MWSHGMQWWQGIQNMEVGWYDFDVEKWSILLDLFITMSVDGVEARSIFLSVLPYHGSHRRRFQTDCKDFKSAMEMLLQIHQGEVEIESHSIVEAPILFAKQSCEYVQNMWHRGWRKRRFLKPCLCEILHHGMQWSHAMQRVVISLSLEILSKNVGWEGET